MSHATFYILSASFSVLLVFCAFGEDPIGVDCFILGVLISLRTYCAHDEYLSVTYHFVGFQPFSCRFGMFWESMRGKSQVFRTPAANLLLIVHKKSYNKELLPCPAK